MEMFAMDTNVLVLAILSVFGLKMTGNEIKYLDFYRNVETTAVCVPDFVLAEFEIVTRKVLPYRYHLSASDAKKLRKLVYEQITSIVVASYVVSSSSGVFKSCLDWYDQQECRDKKQEGISIIDYWLVAASKEEKMTIVSLDARLCKFAESVGVGVYLP